MLNHVAVIMDGNRRWAKDHGYVLFKGHQRGVLRLIELVEAASEKDIKALTVYAWSKDNFSRSELEKNMIFELMVKVSKSFCEKMMDLNVVCKHIGDLDSMPKKVQDKAKWLEEKTKHNTGVKLFIAIGYSSRGQMASVVRSLAKEVASGRLNADELTDVLISETLALGHVSEPELLIRTSGEQRLSDFLLWEVAYSELYFSPKYWPDFTKDDFGVALEWYQKRDRRLGC